jgi:hypothetical protein
VHFLNGRGRPGCFKHQVGTPTFGQFIDHLSQVFFRNVNGPDRAKFGRQVQFGLLHVGQHHLAASACKSRKSGDHPDRTRANYHGQITRFDLCLERRLHSYRQRFHHGPFGETDVRG